MKYSYVFLIFIFGVAVGRWSTFLVSAEHATSGNTSHTESAANVIPEMHSAEADNTSPTTVENSSSKESSFAGPPSEEKKSLTQADDRARNKQMNKLFGLLIEANEKDNIEERSRLLAEMEALDPKHEKVFQAKVMFLQDDEDWDGAHKVLEECVAAISNSAYCLERLANIRSSTVDERVRYGMECLQVSKNDLSCMVDLAIALRSKGDPEKSKYYFEQALSLPLRGAGYDRSYILYQYGFTLESLNLDQKAKAAFTESCRLRMKAACEHLKT